MFGGGFGKELNLLMEGKLQVIYGTWNILCCWKLLKKSFNVEDRV